MAGLPEEVWVQRPATPGTGRHPGQGEKERHKDVLAKIEGGRGKAPHCLHFYLAIETILQSWFYPKVRGCYLGHAARHGTGIERSAQE